MKDPVLHSSLSPVLRLNRDIDDLSFPTSIGVVIQKGSLGYLLTFHEPKLSSCTHGVALTFEETSLDDLDKRTREALLAMSKACKLLAQDFLAHAERLKAEAKKEHLVDESQTPKANPVRRFQVEDAIRLDERPDKNHANMRPLQSLDYTDPKTPTSPTPDPFD